MNINLSSFLISQSHTKKAVYQLFNSHTKNRQKIKYKWGFFYGYVDQEKVSFNTHGCFPFATNFALITEKSYNALCISDSCFIHMITSNQIFENLTP